MSIPRARKALAPKSIRETIESLKSGPSVTLHPSVSGLSLRYVAKNSEKGPRQFIREIAPRIAFANPVLPITIHRIPDPRSKSKDPKGPDAGAVWEGGIQPKPEMTIDFHDGPSRTVSLAHLSSSTILQQLLTIASETPIQAIEAPSSNPADSSSSPSTVSTPEGEVSSTASASDGIVGGEDGSRSSSEESVSHVA